MKKSTIAIFASGEGTNAINIVEYFRTHNLPASFFILSDRKAAPVLNKAKMLEIPSISFSSKELYENGFVLKYLQDNRIDFIVLAGFLKLVPLDMIRQFKNRIINIHPALLPKYGGQGMFGMHVHRSVHNNLEKETGITIHEVNENFDEGTILFQKSVALTSQDTPESIREKVHTLEMEYFPKVIESKLKEL
jgi:phosphoribosylglycinamide formyltransferase-1